MNPFWVKTEDGSRLAIVPRPRGGDWLEDELCAIKTAGVDVLVSMLTTEERDELGLQHEAKLSELVGLKFISFPIRDRETPENFNEFLEFLRVLESEVNSGKSVATHCRAFIGRASIVLASLMCLRGWNERQAFAMISEVRGMTVPDTQEQIEWVSKFLNRLEALR